MTGRAGYTGLVAAREVRQRIRGRIFRVGTILILAAVGAAIVVPALNKEKTGPQQIGVVGALPVPLRSAITPGHEPVGSKSAGAGCRRGLRL